MKYVSDCMFLRRVEIHGGLAGELYRVSQLEVMKISVYEI
jgi:hypothetical protein